VPAPALRRSHGRSAGDGPPAVPPLRERAEDDLHARRIETFVTRRPKDTFGTHRNDPADFDWIYAGLAEEFSDYTARYHVRSETRAPA
jgi:hypothetical protein